MYIDDFEKLVINLNLIKNDLHILIEIGKVAQRLAHKYELLQDELDDPDQKRLIELINNLEQEKTSNEL